MADIWTGDIVLPNGGSIADVGLTSLNVALSPALPATSLRFLSTVDPARIPLYLAAGPSLDVWTTSEATEAWFESILLSKPAVPAGVTSTDDTQEWWSLARSQAPIGFLAQVHSQAGESQKVVVTELLFYGTIAAPAAQGLPTPSASPAFPNAQPGLLPELRVHALPLSSQLLNRHVPPPLSPTSDALHTEVDAQFLPPLHDAHVAPKSPIRKRDLFEEATLARKKARSKGGEGIAAAAARGSESQHVYSHRKSSIDAKVSPFPDIRPSSAQGLSRPSSRQLSRSPSISSDIRPLSRKDASDVHNKRSNLSRVATISLQPEEPTTESRNKEALSRVVMAAMRMHGLQQRKKTKSRRASVVSGLEESQPVGQDTAAEDAAKDEEYKLIYHQTYKGAALALRNHITEKPLHAQSDKLRDLVEKLLAIFLTDPLAEPLPPQEPAHPVATPGGKPLLGVLGSTHGHASPFDLPSGSRPPMMRSRTEGHINTGSPISRRTTGGGMLDGS